MVYVKNDFQCNEIKWSNCNDLECIGLNITLSPHMTFTVIVLYRPPSSDCSFYQKLEILLKNVILTNKLLSWETSTTTMRIIHPERISQV